MINYEKLLLELLARIHRDGGQYTQEHGIEKSVQDADLIVAEVYSKILQLETDLRVITGLYADAVKRNVLLTERLESRMVDLTPEQRDTLHKTLIRSVRLY